MDDVSLNKLRAMVERGFVSELGDLLEAILDMIPEAIIIANKHGMIVLINAAFERLTGYNRKTLVGNLVEILVPERTRDFHRQMRERYMEDPKPRMMAIGADIFLLTPDGGEVAILAELLPLGEYILIKARMKDKDA